MLAGGGEARSGLPGMWRTASWAEVDTQGVGSVSIAHPHPHHHTCDIAER
jgi:hypothetical protein